MDMNELEVMIGKRIRGVSYEVTDNAAYLMIVTTGGKTFVFRTPYPIELDVESEH